MNVYKFAPALVLLSLLSIAQNVASPAEYSFTISGSQTWTDTGVDLSSGDTLSLTAQPKAEVDAGCSPMGSGPANNTAKLPLPSASEGALIGRTSENSDAVLVGSAANLNSANTGHLYLGLNQTVQSNCAYTVKVQLVHAANATAQTVAPQSLTTQGAAVQPAATQTGNSTTQHTDMKQELSSAAQVWLKGQFGSSSTSSAAGNAALGGSAAATPSTTATLNLPAIALDADLRQHLDGLPRRVHDHAGNLGDMVNFVIVGTEDQMQAAVNAADWHVADLDSKEAGLKAVLDTYQKKDYLEMPMSHLYLFDRMQDFGYEQAQAFAVVASRHHFRIWKAPFTWNNEIVWVGAATHDVGFEKDVRTGKLTHKIDPDVDSERANLGQGLDKTGKVKQMTFYLPPNPVQDAKNASGGGYHSDGRLLVVFLK